MSGFNTVGMTPASMEEMRQTDGGLLVFFIGMAIGYGVTKGLMGGGGGGETLPGMDAFLAATKGIAAAGHPK
jgi:hypothetical protein